jgi:hypothetical protein
MSAAAELNARKLETPSGAPWSAKTVIRARARVVQCSVTRSAAHSSCEHESRSIQRPAGVRKSDFRRGYSAQRGVANYLPGPTRQKNWIARPSVFSEFWATTPALWQAASDVYPGMLVMPTAWELTTNVMTRTQVCMQTRIRGWQRHGNHQDPAHAR